MEDQSGNAEVSEKVQTPMIRFNFPPWSVQSADPRGNLQPGKQMEMDEPGSPIGKDY